ncbi:MAG: hypothetical protein HQL87_03240 [Magnetococcales bacterium]|nr:hypothetical protein [Magnetococcales bacterium]
MDNVKVLHTIPAENWFAVFKAWEDGSLFAFRIPFFVLVEEVGDDGFTRQRTDAPSPVKPGELVCRASNFKRFVHATDLQRVLQGWSATHTTDPDHADEEAYGRICG